MVASVDEISNKSISIHFTMSAVPDPLSPLRVVDVMRAVLSSSLAAATAMPAALPSSERKTKHDLVALLLHSALLALDFRCIGLGEDGPTLPHETAGRVLPAGWNGSETYGFRYRHAQSTMTFVVKAVRMVKTLIVHGCAIEDGRVFSIHINVDEQVTSSAASRITAREHATLHPDDIDSMVFIKPAETLRSFRTNIIEKLVANLYKDGYEEARISSAEASVQTSQSQESREPPRVIPTQPNPIPLYPPSSMPPSRTGDEYDPLRIRGPIYPSNIGQRDLDPLAAGGMGPPGRGIPFGNGGGMIVGPDDPMFFGNGGGVPRPNRGQFGPSILPPGAVPPGARFDPITPFGGPRPRFGGRGNFASGDPDNDELPPPGYGDMFM